MPRPCSPSRCSESVSLPTGNIASQIAALQADPAYRDAHDFRHGAVIDELTKLYGRMGGPEAQDHSQEQYEDQPDEPWEMKPVGDAVDDALDALETQWGEDLVQNIQIAQRAGADLSRSLGGSVETFLDSAGLANDATVIKVFHALGSGAEAPKLSKAEAQRLLSRLQSTPDYLR
jgi:hypothetical protein